MRDRTVSLAAALLLLGACRRTEPERAAQTAAAEIAAVPQAPQDTAAFAGTTDPITRPRAGTRPGILHAVRAAPHPAYDRIVFEFAGDSLPGYRVEYASRPVVRCGSGNRVPLAGAARLVVRFEPARAHDERGTSSVERRESAPALPAIKELKLVCDFEGQVEWVLGVAAATPYRVLEERGPARLVLDVRHGP